LAFEAELKRRTARAGKLAINVDYARLPSGEKPVLRGVQDLKGGATLTNSSILSLARV
jgi:hypothetical protein